MLIPRQKHDNRILRKKATAMDSFNMLLAKSSPNIVLLFKAELVWFNLRHFNLLEEKNTKKRHRFINTYKMEFFKTVLCHIF